MAANSRTAGTTPVVRLLINGGFIESASTQWRDAVNPATQDVLARVLFATAGGLDRALAAAQRAFKTWRKTLISVWARIFLTFQHLVRACMGELAALLTAEQGKTLADAAFGAAGQRCMAVSAAVLVGESRKGGLDIVAEARKLAVAAGHQPHANVSPLISRVAKERVARPIAQGQQADACLELDGRNVAVAGFEQENFIGPTILSGLWPGNPVYDQEVFGPVGAIVDAATLDEAITLINANPNGNGTAIFTQPGAAARKFQEEIDVGQVGINVPIPIPVPLFSFSGSRASKLGDLGPCGKQVVRFYTQTKKVTERWFEDDIVTGRAPITISLV